MSQAKPTLAERKCGPALEDHSIPSQQSFAGFHRARGPTNVGVDGDPMEINLANCPDHQTLILPLLYRGWTANTSSSPRFGTQLAPGRLIYQVTL